MPRLPHGHLIRMAKDQEAMVARVSRSDNRHHERLSVYHPATFPPVTGWEAT
jgi:hypothetical protein